MKKNILVKCLIFLSYLMFIWACQSSNKNSTPVVLDKKEEAQVLNSMQGLKTSIDELIPFVLNPSEFASQQNNAVILQKIRNLEKVSSSVNHLPLSQAQDPSFNVLSSGLKEDVTRAREAFQLGKFDYARSNLLKTASYCIECHTRTKLGPSFQTSELTKQITQLRSIERGEYYLMTRQFDSAQKEFDKVINGEVASNMLEMDRVIRLSLFMAVRFDYSPIKTLEVTEKVLKSAKVPQYIKAAAKEWKSSASSWKKEKRAQKDYLSDAQRILQVGHQKIQKNDDRAGDIEVLRVQAILHRSILGEKNNIRLAQAYYLLGLAYEIVHDVATWSLNEDYFETCIRKAPHSAWAAKCYKKFEESTYLGYSGSAGVSIPEEVKNKLNQLKMLAQ